MRTQVPGEVQATTQSRNLLDAHFVRRLTPALNLRLSVQNLQPRRVKVTLVEAPTVPVPAPTLPGTGRTPGGE